MAINDNDSGIQELSDGGESGTRLGSATTEKVGFYGTAPVTQPLATTDLGTVLSNLGIRAVGTAYPITTTGAVTITAGTVTTLTSTTATITGGTVTTLTSTTATITGGTVTTLTSTTGGITTANITDLNLANDMTITDAGNIILATTTGTRIGTTTLQKIGFFNKTPVVQQTATAGGTDATTTQALANGIRTALIDFGLWA